MLQESSEKTQERVQEAMDKLNETNFKPFQGENTRIDGRKKGMAQIVIKPNDDQKGRGIPDYTFEIGTLKFIRKIPNESEFNSNLDDTKFVPFSGTSHSLKNKSNKY
ncbi:hypothetical protein HZS_3632 [Henneguya salminicola]|nr:hypothetical protein HZS_3632 [Henneguya salminicola]